MRINKELTISGDTDGDFKADVIISGDADGDGDGDSRVINAGAVGGPVRLQSLTIQDGASNNGAGILSNGTELELVHVTVQNNTAGNNGGGVFGDYISAVNTTFAFNDAGSTGGGIYVRAGGTAYVGNTTIASNGAATGGGIGVGANGIAGAFSSTIALNAGFDGAGVGFLRNEGRFTAVAQNYGPFNVAADVGGVAPTGPVVYSISSFFSSDVTAGGAITLQDSGGTINAGGPAGFTTLGDNGGSVNTLGRDFGSPLVDAGSTTFLFPDVADIDGDGDDQELVPFDANGNARVFGAALDIGATETPPTLIVDNFGDVDDGDYSAGNFTLREAIDVVQDGQTIAFSVGGTIDLTSRLGLFGKTLAINGDVDGDGVADVTLNQTNGGQRVVDIAFDSDVELRSLILTGGTLAFDVGAGITVFADSSLTLVNSEVSGNTASNGAGLAVRNGSDATVINSLIAGNTATGGYIGGPSGGGAFVGSGATATFINSTIASNVVGDDTDSNGAGIFNEGSAFLISTTITDNYISSSPAGDAAAGVYTAAGGYVGLERSIISGNFEGSNASDFNALGTTAFFFPNSIVGSNFGGPFSTVSRDLITPDDIFVELTTRGGGALSSVPGAPTQVAQIKAGGAADKRVVGQGEFDTFDVDGDGDSAELIDVDGALSPRSQGFGQDVGAVEARPILVDTLDDVVDATDGLTSLREAVTEGLATGNGIAFDSSLQGGTLVLTQGQIQVSDAETLTINGDIDGDGRADVTISGDINNDGVANSGDTRLFDVATGGAVNLTSLALENGYASDGGGALRVDGDASLLNISFTGNSAEFAGGAVRANANATVTGVNVTFNDNSSGYYGGALYAFGGDVHLYNATFTNNSAARLGGAISLASGAEVYLYHNTITDNSDTAVEIYTGSLVATNSIIANNTGGAGNPANFVKGSNGILELGNTLTSTDVSTLINNDLGGNIFDDGLAGLGPLADNGGPVDTLALTAGSIALNAGIVNTNIMDVLDVDNDGDTLEELLIAANGVTRGSSGAGLPDLGAFEDGLADLGNVVVDTLVDEDDGFYGAGDLSLREALTLVDDGGSITFADGLSGSILLNSELELTQSVFISGDTNGDLRADIALNGQGTTDVLLASAGTSGLASLTLTNGYSNFNGVAGGLTIESGADLTIVNSTISDNFADESVGGGVYNKGGLTLVNSTLSGNTVFSDGLFVSGGGLFGGNASTTALVNVTVANNSATATDGNAYGGGVGVGIGATLTATHSTIAGNSVSAGPYEFTYGAGLFVDSSNTSATLTNSIVLSNTGADDVTNFGGGLITQGVNFLGTNVYQAASVIGQTSVDRVFFSAIPTLGNYGGPVQTLAMQFVGDHQNIGDPAFIPTQGQDVNADGFPELPFPVDARLNNRAVNGTPDLGAVEATLEGVAGTNGNDIPLDGTNGDDLIDGLLGNDLINGFAGDDSLSGSFGDDTINGGDNNDSIVGRGDNDLINGGAGDDNLDGGSGNDTVLGDDGDDTILGGLGDDTMDGGLGDDIFQNRHGNNLVIGGDGRDSADYFFIIRDEASISSGLGSEFIISGVDFTDTVSEVERARFNDVDVFLGASEQDGPLEIDPEFAVRDFDRFVHDFGTATVTKNIDPSGEFIGSDVEITGNAFKFIEINSHISADTVLSFDLTSPDLGEVAGIGFDTNATLQASDWQEVFKLGGNQTPPGLADTLLYQSNGLAQRYEIAVGDYLSGFRENLVLIADDDFNGSGTLTFSDLQFFERKALIVDGAETRVTSYGLNQDKGEASVSDDGSSVTLQGNAWKSVDINAHITSDTWLTFTLDAEDTGEILGIGFDNNQSLSINNIFQLSGFQTGGIQDFRSYTAGDGIVTVSIPVGQYYTGAFSKMVFAGDDDSAGGSTDATFSDIALTEGQPIFVGDLAVAAQGGYVGQQAGNVAVSATPEGGGEVAISGNGWRLLEVNANIDASTVISFEMSSTDTGEFLAIGVDNDTSFTPAQFVKLGGTENPPVGATELYTGGGASEMFEIPIGMIAAPGTYQYLVLAVDDDANGSGNATFSNIEILSDPTTAFVSSYGTNQDKGKAQEFVTGGTLKLTENAWKDIELGDFEIDANTVLHFEFRSDVEGEVHAVGFDNNDANSFSDPYYQLLGTDVFGPASQDFNNQYVAGTGFESFEIAVGQDVTGIFDRFVMITDDDVGNPVSDSYFRDVYLTGVGADDAMIEIF